MWRRTSTRREETTLFGAENERGLGVREAENQRSKCRCEGGGAISRNERSETTTARTVRCENYEERKQRVWSWELPACLCSMPSMRMHQNHSRDNTWKHYADEAIHIHSIQYYEAYSSLFSTSSEKQWLLVNDWTSKQCKIKIIIE